MSDAAVGDEKPFSGTVMQPFCNACQVSIVTRLHMGPDDIWRAAIIISSILMFQATMTDAGVNARIGDSHDQETISLILAERGCPGCAMPDAFERLLLVLDKGLDHAVDVSKWAVLDANFPYVDRILPQRTR